MKIKVGWMSAAIVLAALAPLPSRATSDGVVDVPVAFQVLNTNTTVTKCQPDGKPYTIRGDLVAPADALTETAHNALTLYIHGSGDGATWHFTAVPGVDYVTEMARMGHVSVFIHNLGYGASDPADGAKICYGSIADIAHQVVQSLRAGTYDAGEQVPISFERVALAGHSGGALAVELYSISYHDIDALVIDGWADTAPTLATFYTGVAGFGVKCAQGGESKQTGGPKGWAKIFTTRQQFDALFFNADLVVEDAFIPRYEGDPCGIAPDAGQVIAESLALSPMVDIPILLSYGDHDPFGPGAFEFERSRYVSSHDVSLSVLPATGHQIMLGRTAPAFRVVMSNWLSARGF